MIDEQVVATPAVTEPTKDELLARIAELEGQVRGQGTTRGLTFRVAKSGGVSVYGLGRFPVTLFYSQWTRLIQSTPELTEYLEANKGTLKMKPENPS